MPRERVDLSALRAMMSTGSILHDSLYDWVRANVGELPLQSISGGTDIIGCFVLGNPTLPAIHGGVVGAFMEQAGAQHLRRRSSPGTVQQHRVLVGAAVADDVLGGLADGIVPNRQDDNLRRTRRDLTRPQRPLRARPAADRIADVSQGLVQRPANRSSADNQHLTRPHQRG